MTSFSRRLTTGALALALLAGPALVAGAQADAKGLKRATVTATMKATVSAQRTAAMTMSATVVATVPGSDAAPVRVSQTASATRTATSVASSAGRKTATARAVTRKKASSKARKAARRGAWVIAQRRASGQAAAKADSSARTAAQSAASSDALARAKAEATRQAAAQPGGSTQPPTTEVVSVTPVAAPCGGVSPARADGTGRYATCTFDDEFGDSTLDTSKWYAMDAQKDNFAIGDECFKPSNVSESAGALNLTATKTAAPITCAKKQRSYQSGLVMTKGKFSQTYGRFEMRAKFPKDAGYVSGFWMLPENPTAGGVQNYKYGEIDVVENWALHPELMWAHLHYAYTPGNYMGGTSCTITPDDNFHTYAVDWTSSKMTFSYDNKTCWTTTWTPAYPYAPAGSKAPAPFDQPFYMILNLSVGGSGSTAAKPLSATTMGKSMQVDWVRAWK